MLQAILFDLDGTLAHTDPIHLSVWQSMLAPYGLVFDETFYKANFSGRLNPDIVRDLLPQLSPAEGEQLSTEKEAQFRMAAADRLKPLPGLMSVIAWLKRQRLLSAIVTNAPRPNAEFMIQTLRLTNLFDTVVISSDLPRGKPDPLPYQTALQRLEIEPAQAVVFEDSPSGIRAAIAAGITTVGVATTYTSDELYNLGVTLAIQDFTDERLEALGIGV
ncbi:MAG: HAD family phosphatase [Cyanobacteria bacterium P01_A01_bin.114]